jgi:hypothetical protein
MLQKHDHWSDTSGFGIAIHTARKIVNLNHELSKGRTLSLKAKL